MRGIKSFILIITFQGQLWFFCGLDIARSCHAGSCHDITALRHTHRHNQRTHITNMKANCKVGLNHRLQFKTMSYAFPLCTIHNVNNNIHSKIACLSESLQQTWTSQQYHANAIYTTTAKWSYTSYLGTSASSPWKELSGTTTTGSGLYFLYISS